MNRFHTQIKALFTPRAPFSLQKVVRSGFGKKFSIEYDGQKTDEIESILKQMHDWFFHTHIKDAEDNEF